MKGLKAVRVVINDKDDMEKAAQELARKGLWEAATEVAAAALLGISAEEVYAVPGSINPLGEKYLRQQRFGGFKAR